jgi:phage tail-like protein
MATIINNRSSLETDPIRNFRFLVYFKPLDGTTTTVPGANGTVAMGFTSVSGLAVTTESIPYREGGYNTTFHQIPGQTTFAPLNLQRGVVLGTSANWDWMRMLFATVQGGTTSTAGKNFRCDLEIQVLSHPVAGAGQEDGSTAGDHVALRYNVYNAWIQSISYSDLTAGDNAIFVEQINLVHEGFDMSWAKDLTTDADKFDTITTGTTTTTYNVIAPKAPTT